MEKSQAEKKSSSFSFFRSKEEADPLPDTSLEVVLQEVDLFVVVLSSTEDKSALPRIPAAAESLPAKVESMISRPDGVEDDLLDAVRRLASVHDLVGEYAFDKCPFHGRSSAVLAKAMAFLEKRFRGLLEDHKGSKTLKSKSFDKDNSELNRTDSAGSGGFPGYSEETVAKMSKIATVMVSAGKEAECGQIYHSVRRKAMKSELNRLGLGFEKINGDDVPKMAWEAMENQISSCIQILKTCAGAIFPAERRLCESVFANYPEIYHREYTNLGMTGLTRLLGFAGAVPKTKRSTDKLFKFLVLYECFRDVTLEIEDSYLECGVTDLTVEISSVKERLAGSAIEIFGELEKTIRSDAGGKAPAPNGDVHNTTRYTMNYLRNACEYRSTLEQIFLQGQSITPPPAAEEEEAVPATPTPNDDGTPKNSPFAAQLMKTIDLLDETLESRSALYKDASLRLVFLMNNGRYILQKMKESPDIHELVGDNFYRKRSSAVRMHHKNYTRETWGRLLQTLNPQGLVVTNGKLISKPMLKERFKSFNHTFEEIHKTQSAWVVGEEQLQSEMRASVAAMVIPAYRSFLARFLPFLTPGRQVEKYVKYQPDDVETLIEGLFSGSPSTIGRKNKN